MCVTETIPFSKAKQAELKAETAKDNTLVQLQSVIMEGWPENRNEVPPPVRAYWEYRDELIVYDGIVFKNDCVVIPKSMRNAMLKIIHQGHFGIILCKKRARDVLFWPGMNGEIKDVVSKCSVCLELKNQQRKEPLMLHKVPKEPWNKIGSDLFEIEGDHYLITADYYSEFFEINELGKSMTASKVIKCTKEHCARYEIPDELMSDKAM